MSEKICSVNECDSIVHAKNYCDKHYRRFIKYKDPLFTKFEMNGISREKEYRIWYNIKKRCRDKKNKDYNRYGGRGIDVCDSWFSSFETFIKDMGSRPTSKHQVDRIDNNKGYYKENCRWVTATENNRNKRNNVVRKEDVINIRKRYKKGELPSKILKDYNMTNSNLEKIIYNINWKNI